MFENRNNVWVLFFLVGLVLVGIPRIGKCQVRKMDSTYSKTTYDTTTLRKSDNIPLKRKGMSRPTVATLLSLAVPGAGQVYNAKYWKVPIIYALLGGLISWAVDNGWKYNVWATRYNEAFSDSTGSNYTSFKENFPSLTDSELTNQIRVIRDGYRRDRDYAIILTSLVYALNIVDACVDAHLREFDVNEKIALKIRPTLMSDGFNSLAAGVCLQVRIKPTSHSFQQSITF